MKKNKPHKSPKATSKKKAKRATKKEKPGRKFEVRTARAMAQVYPDLDVKHDQQLPTEYGVPRQFDVAVRAGEVLHAVYEAREHGRKVDIGQLEAFSKKVDKLVDKPVVAGLISSKGFTETPVKWINRYGTSERVQELYTLKASVPDDWNGDLRQIAIRMDGQSLRPKSLRLISPVEGERATTIEVSLVRSDAFLVDGDGSVVGNLLDVLNAEVRAAQIDRNLGPRRVDLPDRATIMLNGVRVRALALETEFEQFVVPANTLIDYTHRFPDALAEVISGRKWLIEDPERALKASRTGLDLTLGFPPNDEPGFVDIVDLTAPIPSALEDEVGTRVAHLSLGFALRLVYRVASGEADGATPKDLLDTLALAREHFIGGRIIESKQHYLTSLSKGTALEALCNLACIALDESDHNAAISYSTAAAKTFPLEPHGFVNLAAALLAAGRGTEARSVLDGVRFLHGSSAMFRRRDAGVLFSEGKTEDAARVLYSVVLDDPADVESLVNLARCEAKLGRLGAAAWDAMRALRVSPNDQEVAEQAAKMAARARDHKLVLEVGRICASHGVMPALVLRLCVNAAIEMKRYEDAAEWCDQIPEATRTSEEWLVHGKLANVLNRHESAIAHLRRALVDGESRDAVSLWLADSLLSSGEPTEARAVLDGVGGFDARALRAKILCDLNHADELIAELEGIRSSDVKRAHRLAAEISERAFRPLRPLVMRRVVEWVMGQDTDDPAVLLKKAAVEAARTIESGDQDRLASAERLANAARDGGAKAAQTRAVDLMIAVARKDEERALILAEDLAEPHDGDVLAMLVGFAFRARLFELVERLAVQFFSSGTAPTSVLSESTVVLHRVMAGFCAKRSRDDVENMLAGRTLPTDVWGRTANAVIAYVRGELTEAQGILSQIIAIGAEGQVPFPAVVLNGQCLAEQARYHELVAYCQEWCPQLESLAAWAAERAPVDGPMTPTMRAAASAASFMHHTEFLSVKRHRHTMVVLPGRDWVQTLTAARNHDGDCEAVWVAQIAYPLEFLSSVFTPR